MWVSKSIEKKQEHSVLHPKKKNLSHVLSQQTEQMLYRWCDFWAIKRQDAYRVNYSQVLIGNILHDNFSSFFTCHENMHNAHSRSTGFRSAMISLTMTVTTLNSLYRACWERRACICTEQLSSLCVSWQIL